MKDRKKVIVKKIKKDKYVISNKITADKTINGLLKDVSKKSSS